MLSMEYDAFASIASHSLAAVQYLFAALAAKHYVVTNSACDLPVKCEVTNLK